MPRTAGLQRASGDVCRVRLSLMLPTYLVVPPANWDFLRAITVAAQDAGFDRVVVADHVVFGEALDDYGRPELGGRAGGRQPTGPDGLYLEPFVILSYLAAVTTRIRLGTNVLLAALRRPVVLAKQASSLDSLSGGRLELGVGVGWQRAEYEAAGLDFSERGRLLDRSLEICRLLWSERAVSYHTPSLEFENIHQMPKPVQDGGVPLWIGGSLRRQVVDRVARNGLRWSVWGASAGDLQPEIAQMRQALIDRGEDASRLRVATMLPAKVTDDVLDVEGTRRKADLLIHAGVTDLIVPPDLGWWAIAGEGGPADSYTDLAVADAAERLRPLVKAIQACDGGRVRNP